MIHALSASAAALPACVIISMLACASAPAGQTPTNLVANQPILLCTTTPLGEAEIKIAAGTTLTNFEIQGDQVRVWQGPFTATVALAAVQPPEPEPTASPTPPTPMPEPTPDTVPTPEAATPQPQEPSLAGVFDSGLWPPWVFPAAVGALAIYALLATLALIRLRHPSASAPLPSTIMPQPASVKPSVVSDSGHSIHCPHCGADIPIERLSAGRNTCPSCKGGFICE